MYEENEYLNGGTHDFYLNDTVLGVDGAASGPEVVSHLDCDASSPSIGAVLLVEEMHREIELVFEITPFYQDTCFRDACYIRHLGRN